MVAGETTVSRRPWPSILTSRVPIPVALSTPSIPLSPSASEGLSPPKPWDCTLMAKSPLNCSVKRSLIWPLMLAASADTAVTSATPISTGLAVRAVRFGLRTLFWRAMTPVMPRSFAAGVPRKRPTGGAMTGPSTIVPPKTKRMPSPSHDVPSPPITAPMTPRPRATEQSPIQVRVRPTWATSIAVERIAARGGTLPARRAGSHADDTVTMTPTTIVLTTAAAVTTRPLLGMSMPRPFSSAVRPLDSPMPPTMPSTDPTSPTTTDSASIAREICLRLAPTARRSAFSRWRWAALIENTL